MQKIFLILFALIIPLLGKSAQTFPDLTLKCQTKVTIPKNVHYLEPTENSDVTVTLTVDYDSDMLSLVTTTFIFTGNQMIVFDDFSGTDTEIQIPLNKGTYDFVVILSDIFAKWTILSVNDVKVEKDMIIPLSADDATELISFKPMMPNGEALATELSEYDEKGNKLILEEGNAYKLMTFMSFFSKKYGNFMNLMGNEMRYIENGEEICLGAREIRAMPNSELYLDKVYSSFNSDGSNIIYIPAPELKTADLSNDVENYVILDEEYLPSPFSLPSRFGDGVTPYDKSRGFSASYWMTGNPHTFGESGSTVNNMDFEKRLLAVCQPKNASRQIWPVLKFNEWEEITTKTQPINPLSYKVLGINNLFGYQYLMNEDGWYPAEPDCINENLSFELGDTPKWGEGVPVSVSLTRERTSSYSIAFTYCGNMCEERSVDIQTVEPVIKINGTAATEDQLQEISENQMPENSLISWECLNTNITPIEGISPYNLCVTEVSTKTSDRQAPTVQALRFHREDGKPALNFEKSGDGFLMLYAGDFKYNPLDDWSGWCNFNGTPALTLEYRPNGSEAFTALEYKEDPEKFFMPGYGACFTAALAQVNVESANKWYDLRITLKDEAGNSQQQILSPAFRIEKVDGAGIAALTESLPEYFDIYTAQGILMKKSAVRDFLPTLPSGLYIIAGRKVLIP